MGVAAFSLVEVIAAVAVFAIGIVAIVGLFSSLLRPLAELENEDTATGLAGALQVEFRRLTLSANSLAPVVERIKSVAALTELSRAGSLLDPATDAQLLFAPRSAQFVAAYEDSRWHETHTSPHFAVALFRNPSLPYSEDALSPDCVTYTVEVRWPAFVQDLDASGAARVAPVPFRHQDHLRWQGAMAR